VGGGDAASGVLDRLLEVLAPGPSDLVALIEAYFDESYSDKGDRHFCVAGYVFDTDKCRQLDTAWAATLTRFNLPYFRMSACAHGNPPFDRLTKGERIDAATEMIGHINKYAKFGIVTTVSEAAVLKSEKDPVDPLGSAYTLLCYLSLLGVRQWVRENKFDGKIAYFFEAGSQYQKEANSLMADFLRIPEERAAFRYASHAFVDKQMVRPVQTADILAWQAATDHRRQSLGQGKRADFKELLKCLTFARHVDPEQFLEFRKWWRERPAEEKELFSWGRRTLGRSRVGEG
jgi:hypothetical protein